MAIRKGLTALRETKEQQKRGGGGNTFRFVLQEGESAIIRVYGDFENEEDPFIYKQHFVKRLMQMGKGYHNCAENRREDEYHAGCAFCHVKNTGDKGVNISARALFYVKDHRKQHKFDADVKVLKPGRVQKPGVALPPDAYELTKYPSCKGVMCQFCKQGNEARMNGWRHWELAVQYAEQLVSLQAEIRNYCLCGSRDEDGNGTIYVSTYTCGNEECKAEVPFDPSLGKPVHTCENCSQTLPPIEELACTGCEEPRRCDLKDFLIKVKRTGSKQDTTYNFEVMQPCKPMTEEDLEDAEKFKPDFYEIVSPEPHEKQCQHLGIGPIYNTPGHGATSYAKPAPKPGPATAKAPPAPGAPPKKPPVVPTFAGGKVKFKIPPKAPRAEDVDFGGNESDITYD
jgi:hypothetical protein